MAVVLAAMAFFVYRGVGGALLRSTDQTLRATAAEARARLQSGEETDVTRPLIDRDTGKGVTVAELLDAQGRVVRSTPPGLAPFLDTSTVARVGGGSTVQRTTHLRGRDGEWRLLAVPLAGDTHSAVLVLAGSLSSREESLHRLLVELLLAGPIALVVASLAGLGLASGALRPVESMRRQAAAISASTPGRRLPVPPAQDEIARLAETLNDMLARLEAAIEHERRFVGDASHELRTPLALMRTEIEVALRRPRSAAELEAALRSAGEETERLVRLAEDLLLVARADQEGLPVRKAPVQVAALLEAVAERFAPRARRQGRSLVVSSDEGAVVRADRARLEQALVNMVDNAITHGAGTVELSASVQAGRVELHVRDEGPGFPAAFAPRAFDRFSRADEARGRGGAGLGLSIVELVARAHGGEAHVANRAESGADVWFALDAVVPRSVVRREAVSEDPDAGVGAALDHVGERREK
jgi:signal transduction histidine kinase